MHGFEYQEIDLIMRAVKKTVESPRDVIFAKTTENSLTMKLSDLIEDLSQDHAYLRDNPPPVANHSSGKDSETESREPEQSGTT